MHVLDANEIFWMTFYTYDRIMEEWWKDWANAFALYVKLIEQTRIQQTNQTRTLNVFLKNWLWRWDERLKKARKVLKDLWLIDDVEIRDTLGRIVSHYVRVNYLIDEEKIRTLSTTYNLSTNGLNGDVDKSTSGETDTNALSTKIVNAWSTKNKLLGEQKIPTPSDLVEAYRNTPTLAQKINNEDVVREFAVYKQSTKRTAYKTIDWFIQKLIAYVNLVSYWEIRYDVWDRLKYAVNEARDNWWIQLVRDEKTEQGYQTVKKFNSMTKKQNGQ
jgi:acyl-CoA-binding protein